MTDTNQLDQVVQALQGFQNILAILVDLVALMNLLRPYTLGDQVVLSNQRVHMVLKGLAGP